MPLGRVQQVLRDLVGVRLGRGTLVRWIQQASATLAPVEAQLTAALRQAPVLHSDETGVRRGGQAGVGARGQHADADALRGARQARQRGDRRHGHPARLHRGERA